MTVYLDLDLQTVIYASSTLTRPKGADGTGGAGSNEGGRFGRFLL